MVETLYLKNNRAKNIRIVVRPGPLVRVTVPRFCTMGRAKAFVEQKRDWIAKQVQAFEEANIQSLPPDEVEQLRKKAKDYIPQRVEVLAREHGFDYGTVRIKNITSRWGSCSRKKNLNFSLRLMKLEKKYIDYVILHELCHTIHMNHQKPFWDLMEKVYPGAKTIDREMRKFSTFY